MVREERGVPGGEEREVGAEEREVGEEGEVSEDGDTN